MYSFIFATLLLTAGAFANTEIVKFSAHKSPFVELSFTDSWPILSSKSSNLQWNVTSAPLNSVLPQAVCSSLSEWQPDRQHVCPHELWVVLDMDSDDWTRLDKFTLRLSWPAFHPTDISMTVYDPTSLSIFSNYPPSTYSKETRRKYARIQMVHTGILTFPNASSFEDVASRYEVPIYLILEPLYFGVLPKSVIPIALAIGVLILACLPVAGGINGVLRRVVQKAEDEFESRQKAKTN